MRFKEIDERPNIFIFCRGILVPSRYDGWGVVVPEAMASGRLVNVRERRPSATTLVRPDYRTNTSRISATSGGRPPTERFSHEPFNPRAPSLGRMGIREEGLGGWLHIF